MNGFGYQCLAQKYLALYTFYIRKCVADMNKVLVIWFWAGLNIWVLTQNLTSDSVFWATAQILSLAQKQMVELLFS